MPLSLRAALPGPADAAFHRVDRVGRDLVLGLDARGHAVLWNWEEANVVAEFDAFRPYGTPNREHAPASLDSEQRIALADYSVLQTWSHQGDAIARVETGAPIRRVVAVDSGPARVAASLADGHIKFFDADLKQIGSYAGPIPPAWELVQSDATSETLLAGFSEGVHRLSLTSFERVGITRLERLPLYLMSGGLDVVQLASGEWGPIMDDGTYTPVSTGALLGVSHCNVWALGKLDDEIVTLEYELDGGVLQVRRVHRFPERPRSASLCRGPPACSRVASITVHLLPREQCW